jgi:hypothetical protein
MTTLNVTTKPMYVLRKAGLSAEAEGAWDGSFWREQEIIKVCNFREESSDHHPTTRAKLCFDDKNVYVIFVVDDCYVRSIHTEFQGEVWKDSCVELFVQPKEDQGYFNIEVNCGGALRCSYIQDTKRDALGTRKSIPLTEKMGREFRIYHSLPSRMEKEITTSVRWVIEYRVPFSVLQHFVGPLEFKQGTEWRANLYKCADESSHPHWAAWSPVAERNFHRPQDFGILRFQT